MFSTRAVVRTALLALSFFTILTQTYLDTAHALELPFFGKVTFGNNSTTPNTLRLDVLFGYRSSPQFYTANQDTVEARALVVNNENNAQTGTYETKIYRVSSLWNSRSHTITYDQRFDYVDAEPEDESFAFGEGTLRDLFLDSYDCALREDEFCYQNNNPDDADRPYGGIVIDAKPVFVSIGEDVTLGARERVNIATQWKPEHCGYYRVVVQPFGYQEVLGTDNKARDAYIRVKGCEEGDILDYGAVARQAPETGIGGVLGDTTDIEHLPQTNSGIIPYLFPIFGLMLGGILMTRGTNGMFRKREII